MFYDFRNIIKKQGARGWRLEKEENKVFLSKWEEAYNDNEIRVYLELTETKAQIIKAVKIKNYHKIIEIDQNNEYVKKAKQLCKEYSKENAKTALGAGR